MFTLWIAETEDGYTYTRENFAFKTQEAAQAALKLFTDEGYVAEVTPNGELPSYYQTPAGEPMSPEEFLDVVEGIINNDETF